MGWIAVAALFFIGGALFMISAHLGDVADELRKMREGE